MTTLDVQWTNASKQCFERVCKELRSENLLDGPLQDKFLQTCLEVFPAARMPMLREGHESEARMAKLAFREMCAPAKNLVLGLTDLETKISKCKGLALEQQVRNRIEPLVTSLDLVQSLCNTTFTQVQQLYREYEVRFLQDWQSLISEEKLASWSLQVAQCIGQLDAFAKDFLSEDLQDLQIDLRKANENESVSETLDLYKLYQTSMNTLHRGKDALEFLKRRLVAQDQSQSIHQDIEQSQLHARQNAEARFALHEVFQSRIHGDVYNSNDWQSRLERVEEIQSQEKKLHATLDSSKDTDTVRSGTSSLQQRQFRSIVKSMDTLLEQSTAFRNETQKLRVKTCLVYRKKQDQCLIDMQRQMASFKMTSCKDLKASEELQRLQKARSMMIHELNQIQETFHMKASDLDIIFQSVQSGCQTSKDTLIFQWTREIVLSLESKLRGLMDWSIRVHALLV